MVKIITSGMMGNALEWYDYALYAQFSYIIGNKFFPKTSNGDFLIFAVFAAGFAVRPLGGILFGAIGDKFGRKTILVIGILLMAIPTTAIGLLPTYKQIGFLSPIILIIIRLLQGLSIGGEFSSCITYIVENAQNQRRGITGSTSFISMCIGILIGVIVTNTCTHIMTPKILYYWGWRIPFISGILISIIGMYIRSSLSESPIFKIAKKKGYLSKHPLKDAIYKYWKNVLMGIVIYINVTTPFYTITVFIPQLMRIYQYSDKQINIIFYTILISMIIILPISAFISDLIGRKIVLFIGSIGIIIIIYPSLLILQSHNFQYLFLSQILLATIISTYMGPIPAVLIELAPTKVRLTTVSLSYNISAAIFGGTTPMIGITLQKLLGTHIAISYYVIILAIICTTSLIIYKETFQKTLI